MFSFFFRTPKLHIDCFTADASVHKYTPVVPAMKSMPEWYESVLKMQKSNTKWPHYKLNERGDIDFNLNQSIRTVRSCPGFLDLYKRGFIIENWCDLAFNVTETGMSYHYSNGESPVVHKNDQIAPGFVDHYVVKLKTPWLITTNESMPFVLLGTEWSLDKYNFKMLPGMVNFYYQSVTNAFVVIKKHQPDQFLIPMGQPMVHFIPLTEKRIIINNHCVTEAELNTKRYNIVGTTMGWRRTFSLVRRNEKRKGKCPFGFSE